MYIEEITIDGFKSYATRTVVSGFDPYFNAITGLNGTGKSNILDSICFVLGISNLSQVRVGNLQELVYKQGQAGVTKATVTITFDNSDKKGSPVGYEHANKILVTRQVVIGGKNKYMINNRTVQASQVQNLFHSVQLNVNNPHFLIMQGRIMKVLNMKPQEILGMIEEAAGTRMFETKKQAALRTIEKKAVKMAEIERVLNTDITPTLERLRGEKKHYLQWTANNTEIEKLQRVCVAFRYTQLRDEVEKSSEEQKALEQERDRLKGVIADLRAQIAGRTSEAKKLKQLKEKDYERAYDKAKSHEEAVSKELVKANTGYKNKRAATDREDKSMQSMEKQAHNAGAALEGKTEEIKKCEVEIGAAKEVLAEKDAAVAQATRAYQGMCAGLDGGKDNAGESQTLTEQIGSTGQAIQTANGEVAKWQLKIEHLEKSVAEARAELKKSEQDARKVNQDRQAFKRAVQDLQQQIAKVGYNEAQVSELRARLSSEESAVEGLRHTVEVLSAQVEGRLSFQYKDPERGFNRSRVKGLVARLVQLKDPAASTALEVVAGAKLYHVVVDTEQTGKLILKSGGLKRRVTIIPLNKISHPVLEGLRIQKAQNIAAAKGAQAQLALEIVGYDHEIRAAMEHVFGTTIVCDSLEVAKTITFNAEVGRRTVTLEGDSFDPSGVLTGGSKQNIGAVLSKLQDLRAATDELTRRETTLSDLKSKLARQSGAQKDHERLTSALGIKEHELKLLEERAAQSVHTIQSTQLIEQEHELVEARGALSAAHARGKAAESKHAQLLQKEQSLRKDRESKLKGLERAVNAAKKEHAEAADMLKSLEQRLKVLQLELKQLRDESSSTEQQLDSAKSGLRRLKEEVESLKQLSERKREEHESAKHALEEAKMQLNVCDKDIAKLEAESDRASKELSASELHAKKLDHKATRFVKDKANARKALQHQLEKFPWIETEKEFFGQRGTDYDFTDKDPVKADQRLKRLESEQQGLAKKINRKVMGMIEKMEREYSELIEKLQALENDKEKIESVIEELDVKKNQALEATWVKINRDFGSIFSTLLPGTQAKLEPPEGASSVLEGLEVKVAFGQVWKETLTELSGGQRSLLALSLILSLLLFKPAPMYILDEVDAALDVSHTQNIGAMLRTHFAHSQFIVVSLKEGMFNNANVIFRTRFVDGVSAVTRTLGNGAQLNRLAKERKQDKGEDAKRKRGRITPEAITESQKEN